MGSGVSTRANSTRGVGGTPAKRVTLRPATPEDCRQVWLWRNDEGTRAASFDTSPISFETHERWFHESLRHRDRHVYIALVDGQEAGVVRLDVAGARGIVNIHLAPEWRGRGVGPRTLAALEDVAFGSLHLTRMEAGGLVTTRRMGDPCRTGSPRRSPFRIFHSHASPSSETVIERSPV